MNRSLVLWAGLLSGLYPLSGIAQNTELTSEDNRALLYARQLGFTSSGAPVVRIRIADGLETLSFEPKGSIRVKMSETGGAAVELRGGQRYEARIQKGQAGRYQYGAILSRSESLDGLKKAQEYCALHEIDTEIVPIGSLFALRGSVFDNRENLLMTRRIGEESKARASGQVIIPDELSTGVEESESGHELYTELQSYPTGLMVLSDRENRVSVMNQNLLWIDMGEAGGILHGIEDESGKKGDFAITGQMIVTPDSHGTLSVVQSADVETLLRGIVPAEIFASAPEAALKAQAIAARTTLISQAGARHLSDPYHLCNRQHCQVYRGLTGADARTDRAIESTRGQILMWDNKVVQAYYSAHCGGMSSGSEETWGLPDKPYLRTRSDDDREQPMGVVTEESMVSWYQSEPKSYCSGAPSGQQSYASTKHSRWKVRATREDIEKSLKKRGVETGRVKDIRVLERGASGRVIRMSVVGTGGTYEIARELPIRRFFGGLKSALFAISVKKDGDDFEYVEFMGAGFGHGVGMCQTGAIGMAQRGKGAEEILHHYYEGAEIRQLY